MRALPEAPHQERLHRGITERGRQEVARVIGLRGFVGGVYVEFGDLQFLAERRETRSEERRVGKECRL